MELLLMTSLTRTDFHGPSLSMTVWIQAFFLVIRLLIPGSSDKVHCLEDTISTGAVMEVGVRKVN